MRRSGISLVIAVFFSALYIGCGLPASDNIDKIDLKNRFYWADCDRTQTIFDTETLNFHKFDTTGIANIRETAGPNQEYIWLKAVFTVPPELRHKTLALLISYLHFADKVWVNGTYVGGYGEFPPHEKSALWASHFYSIPAPIINPVSRNTILIKVYCKGRSGISQNVFLGDYDALKKIDSYHTFQQSIIYIFAEGGMLFTAILFFLIFIGRKKEREYLSFSLLCLSSMLFATPLFAHLVPILTPRTIPFLLFMKLTFCLGLYLVVYFLATLIIEFVKKEESHFFRNFRLSLLIAMSMVTLTMPTYSSLMRISFFMLVISIIQVLLAFAYSLQSKPTKEERKSFITLLIVFIPMLFSVGCDFIIKNILQLVDYPYLTLFGWILTTVGFIILLSIKYNKAVAQNEYLNEKLRREVHKQTQELSEKNTILTEEIHRAETDLEMASLVQKKFFPYPPKKLRGWDIAVSYSPLDKVSGDMYDFYIDNDDLNGFSLFDVSGHGIAASLVTMLAKNIIFQSFIRNMRNHETVSRTLYEINDEIIEAKGGIENYLTGLMFRFGNFDINDDCIVEMANAGHPNPILYSAKSNICDEIESGDSEEHHGAIGLDFITVSFPQINFSMAEDDILLFYTDGLTESRNKSNEMFGKERIKRILKESFAKDAQSILEDIVDAFNAFTQGVKRDDDITVVVMKRENSNNFVEELDELDEYM